MKDTETVILDRARQWLGDAFDAETRNTVKGMMENKPEELADAFYRDLEFGTGGLRGIMGAGTNRMNKYTVGMATQGLANYILRSFPELDRPKVVIAYDCRNNSDFFTDITAEVLSANGIGVYVFDALRPTPLLSFAVRELNCQAGIMITASHNPAEYNGYKVYWDDGGQLVPPHDKNVIAEVQKTNVDQILFGKVEKLITRLDESFDEIFISKLKTLSLAPDLIQKHSDLRIVFTPIHATTVRIVPAAFKAFGFQNVFNVPEQDIVDGNFPTVESPNPEEPAAFEMALDRAKVVGADLVMATDPDGDRLGVAVKDRSGEYVLINGNQCAAILTYYVLEQWKKQGKLKGDEYIVKTVVTTELLAEMAASYNVDCYDVLTGFKYIAEKMRLLEGKKRFLCGGEESYGFTVGDFVRDKDAVISCCMVAEAAVWAREKGMTLLDLLVNMYLEYGLFMETLTSITKKGQQGAAEIKLMMDKFRADPPASIDGKTIARIIDFQASIDKDLYLNEEYPVDLPKSNVLQFVLEDGTRITMRPSGTEPKIKFYFGCRSKLDHAQDYEDRRAQLLKSVENIKKELGV
jgi:phosphoglucomutase